MVKIRPGSKGTRPRKRLVILANLFIAAGLLVGLVVAGLYVYGQIEDQRFQQESEQRRLAFETERTTLAKQREAEQAQIERERQALLNAPLPSFENPAASTTPSPPVLGPARRIIVPAIDVDSEVVESEIRNGEWSVPKYVVGHLQGTALPRQPGNSVYAGHIQSISSGNVFARLGDMRVGDQVYLVTTQGQYLYVVDKVRVVANTDMSVVQPTLDSTLTLITCTGTWDFVSQDYLQRLIVNATLYKDSPPARIPVQIR